MTTWLLPCHVTFKQTEYIFLLPPLSQPGPSSSYHKITTLFEQSTSNTNFYQNPIKSQSATTSQWVPSYHALNPFSAPSVPASWQLLMALPPFCKPSSVPSPASSISSFPASLAVAEEDVGDIIVA